MFHPQKPERSPCHASLNMLKPQSQTGYRPRAAVCVMFFFLEFPQDSHSYQMIFQSSCSQPKENRDNFFLGSYDFWGGNCRMVTVRWQRSDCRQYEKNCVHGIFENRSISSQQPYDDLEMTLKSSADIVRKGMIYAQGHDVCARTAGSNPMKHRTAITCYHVIKDRH